MTTTDVSADTEAPGHSPEPDHPPLNTITKRIAAAIHLHASLAEHVYGKLVRVNVSGFAPNFALIDSRILGRHATQARLRRATRDLHLFFVEIGLLLGLFFGVLLFLFGYASPFQMTVFETVVILASYAAAFVVVWNQYSTARDSALLVFDQGDDLPNASPPPPMAPVIEEFLASTEHQNVVLFSGGEPFPGCGRLIHHWSITVDRLPGDDDPPNPKPFTTDDAYKWLVRTIPASLDGADDLRTWVNDEDLPEAIDPPALSTWPETKVEYQDDRPPGSGAANETRPAPRPKKMAPTAFAGWRLFVMGDFAEDIPGLFQRGVLGSVDGEGDLGEPDGDQWTRFRRPRPSIPREVFERYMDDPKDWARPYVYVTLMNANGQLAVTLLVRCEVRPSTIFYEVNVFALRPLSAAFGDIWSIPQTLFTSRVAMFATVAPRCFPLMLRSIKPSFNLALKPRKDREAARKRLVALGSKRDIDFGATSSLREDVAREGLGAHFYWMDEERWFQALNRRSLDMMREFLVDARAPLQDFDRQREEVLRLALERARELYGRRMPDIKG